MLRAAALRRPTLRMPGRSVAVLASVGILCYLILGPLLMVVFSTFRDTDGSLPFEAHVPWALSNYEAVFLRPQTYEVLGTTVIFAVASIVLSFSIGIALAWVVERTDLPFRNLVFVTVIASVGVPNIIAGIAWGLLGSPVNGLLNQPIRAVFGLEPPGPLSVYSLPGMIFVQAITMVPITFLLLSAAFRAMDPAMEDAASTSGARFMVTLRRITIPLLAPAVVSAMVFQFVTVVESFDIPLLIGLRAGIPVLSTEIFIQTRPPQALPNYGLAATYSVLLLALAIGPLLLSGRIIGRSERYATITGKGYQPRRYSLGAWKVPALLAVGVYALVAVVLPVLSMFWTSLQPFFSVPSPEAFSRITFDAYEEILTLPLFHKALLNTLILGVAAGAGTMILGLMVAWILVRSRSRLRPLLDLLAFMPHAFPGVILGLSILLMYLFLPFPLYGTIWIIVLALATQEISLATRLMSGAIAQVQRELEEAAETSGANWFPTMRRVVAPLVLPALLNGFFLIFLSAIKNLTLALILFAQDSVVLSTVLFTNWDQGHTDRTGALGMIMMAVTIIAGFITRRLTLLGATRV